MADDEFGVPLNCRKPIDLFGDPPKLEAVAGLFPLPMLLLNEIPPGLVVLLLFPLFKLPALLRVIYYNKKNVLDNYLQGHLIKLYFLHSCLCQ